MIPMQPLRVLVVDDSEDEYQTTRDLLARASDSLFAVNWAPSHDAGLAAILQGTCDVCLVNYDLDGQPGLGLVHDAQRLGADTPIILLDAHDVHSLDEEIRLATADDCISKGQLTPALLERSVRHVVETNRLRAGAEESRTRWHTLTEHLSVVYFEGDPWSQRLLYVSPTYETMLGHSCAEACAAPRAWLAHVHADDYQRVLASFDDSPYDDLEFRVVRSDGAVRWFRRRLRTVRDASGRVSRVVGTAEDVTPLREAQRQAAATSRLEVLGRQVGAVAHDFNNMLTAVICEAEELKCARADDDGVQSGAQEIIDLSLRAADLTRQLLAFGRQRAYEPRLLDLNALVTGVERMLGRLAGADVALSTILPDDAGFVIADAGQMEQVVVNLVVNARDAMPTGGRLRIETRNVSVMSDTVAPDNVRPGSYVVLSVSDEGTGMSDVVRARIFEPFFSTKAPDAGSGLGLSTVRDFVARSGGAIVVSTEWGRGSTFDVYLPSASDGPTKQERRPRIRTDRDAGHRRVPRQIAQPPQGT